MRHFALIQSDVEVHHAGNGRPNSQAHKDDRNQEELVVDIVKSRQEVLSRDQLL